MGTLSCTLKRSLAVGGGDGVSRGVVLPVALRVGLPVVLPVGGLSFCRSARRVRAGDAIAGAATDPGWPEMADIYPRRGCEREVVRPWTLVELARSPLVPVLAGMSVARLRSPTTDRSDQRPGEERRDEQQPASRDTSAGASQLNRRSQPQTQQIPRSRDRCQQTLKALKRRWGRRSREVDRQGHTRPKTRWKTRPKTR